MHVPRKSMGKVWSQQCMLSMRRTASSKKLIWSTHWHVSRGRSMSSVFSTMDALLQFCWSAFCWEIPCPRHSFCLTLDSSPLCAEPLPVVPFFAPVRSFVLFSWSNGTFVRDWSDRIRKRFVASGKRCKSNTVVYNILAITVLLISTGTNNKFLPFISSFPLISLAPRAWHTARPCKSSRLVWRSAAVAW